MVRGYRFVFRPAWLAGHLLVLAAVVTMALLGHWQLSVSESKGFSLQNFGYSLQWWAFSGFAVVLWAKILRDNARSAAGPSVRSVTSTLPAPPVENPVAYRRYVMPQSSDGAPEATDETHAAYNAYLQSLASTPEESS